MNVDFKIFKSKRGRDVLLFENYIYNQRNETKKEEIGDVK